MSERHLFYTNYESGHSGLSNAIMSIELGVVMAFLTNRFLLLDGNMSPPANIVDYAGLVDNSVMSRVTDLVDLPVPWCNAEEVNLDSLRARELTDKHVMDSVFYVPGTVDIKSKDAQDFARGRNNWLCETEELAVVPVLRVSEDPIVLEQARKRNNLGFYSYFFYFDDETRRSVYGMLRRMQAKAPYLELAKKVAQDLGSFNAIHMRRGDFKVTYGVTVLDRHPWEAIEAMDHHFSRDERLLVCTDERDDPFFDEIKKAWPDNVFVDHHILDNYSKEFAALPHNDSLALALLSQLVAAESQDFIGTMTSTFTSMIQRLRGNGGKAECFKFLWNELPDPGDRFERGRHPVSDCVPLDHGVMIEEYEGNYSWNRYSPRINPAWMREWPESFITPEVLDTGRLEGQASEMLVVGSRKIGLTEFEILFEGLRVRIRSTVQGLAFKLSEAFHRGKKEEKGSILAEFSIIGDAGQFSLYRGDSELDQVESFDSIPTMLVKHLIPLLTEARRLHSWLDGMVFQQAGRTIVYTGDMGRGDDKIADALCSDGWEMLADLAIPLRSKTAEIIPFSRYSWPKGAASRVEQKKMAVTAIVYGTQHLHSREGITELSPAVGVAELIRESFDFRFDRDRAVKRLCTLVEQLPVYGLTFSSAEKAPRILGFLAELPPREVEVSSSS